MGAQLIWPSEVLPAPASDQVPPTSLLPTGEIKNFLLPVDLKVAANCACFNEIQNYLIHFLMLRISIMNCMLLLKVLEVASNPSRYR